MNEGNMKIFPIEAPWPGRLAIVPRPRGGDWLEDDVRAWRDAGFDAVVSLLTPEEMSSFDLEGEADACRAAGLEFWRFTIEDLSVPSSTPAAMKFFGKLEKVLLEGKRVGIHCRQGIGRSSIIAAGLLIISGIDPKIALDRVSAARGMPVPETSEQRNWVTGLARELTSALKP